MFAEDLSVFTADFGVPVRAGTSQATGIVDTERVIETDASGYGVEVERTVCRVAAGRLPRLAKNAAVTVARGPLAGTYRLLTQGPDEGDGAFERLVLAKGAA